MSKSLLRNSSDLPSDNLKKLCLGLTDWCPGCIKGMSEKENHNDALIPHAQATCGKCLSLKWPHKPNPVDTKKAKESDERFSFDMTANDLIVFQKGECPVNTAKSTEWVFNNSSCGK